MSLSGDTDRLRLTQRLHCGSLILVETAPPTPRASAFFLVFTFCPSPSDRYRWGIVIFSSVVLPRPYYVADNFFIQICIQRFRLRETHRHARTHARTPTPTPHTHQQRERETSHLSSVDLSDKPDGSLQNGMCPGQQPSPATLSSLTFTPQETAILQDIYSACSNPSHDTLQRISNQHGMDMTRVRVWFHVHRKEEGEREGGTSYGRGNGFRAGGMERAVAPPGGYPLPIVNEGDCSRRFSAYLLAAFTALLFACLLLLLLLLCVCVRRQSLCVSRRVCVCVSMCACVCVYIVCVCSEFRLFQYDKSWQNGQHLSTMLGKINTSNL